MDRDRIDYYEIRFDNRAGTRQAFISSSAGQCPVVGGEFELNKNEGCGMLQLDIVPALLQGTISMADVVQVWAKTVGGGLIRYYTGTVITVPAAGNTADVHRYEAAGLWYQVERQTITKFWEADTIDDIVAFILAEIDTTDSDISSSAAEIVVSSPYSLGDFEADHMSAAEAIELLAGVQGDIQYGIDEEAKLYFKDLSTTVVRHAWVGKHLEKFEARTESAKTINRLIMQSRQLVGGGQLTLVRNVSSGDHTIAKIGVRDDIVQIPQLTDPDDVWRWAGKELDARGFKTIVDTKLLGVYDFILPRGRVRVTDEDDNEYEFDIQQVRYRFDSIGGLTGEIVFGDEPEDDVRTQFRKLDRELAASKSTAISLTKIEHTRGEEFQQASIIDGQELGLLNHFTAPFTDIKTVDETLAGTVHSNYNKDQHFLTGPFPDSVHYYAQYWSKQIPSGQVVDSVRCHFDFDLYGRLNFDFDSDLDDNWTYDLVSGTGQAWQIKTAENKLQYDNTNGDGRLWYTGPSGFVWRGSGFTFGCGLTDLNRSVGAVYASIYWDWVDSSNWTRLRMHNGSTYLQFWLEKMVGGTPTAISGPFNELKDADHQIVIQARPGGSTTSIWIYRDGALQRTITSTACTLSNDNKVGFGLWKADTAPLPDTPFSNIDYFEIQEYIPTTSPTISYAISRNDGTSISGGTLAQGTKHFTQSVSGQPSGSLLRMRMKTYWPARLYGWGLSFQN